MQILNLATGFPRPTICAYSVIPSPDGASHMVILHELPENPGLPIAKITERLVEHVLDELAPHFGSDECRGLRWIEHYMGMEDGMPEAYIELTIDLEGTRYPGFQASMQDHQPVPPAITRHIRRQLERLGIDVDTYGRFNID